MTDNPNKKTFWDKVHLDPTMLLILLIRLSGPETVIVSGSAVLLPISYSFAGLLSPVSTLIGNFALSTSSISIGMVAVCV